ncbi:hypothetical protein QTN25_008215 [Entamoeba marina]
MFKILVNRIKQTNERITRLKTHHQTTIDLLKKQPTSIKSEEKEPIFIKQLERIHKINAEWNATKQETEEMSEIKQKLEQFDKQNKEIEDMKKKMVELEKQTQSIDGMKNQILELEKFVQTSKNISVSQKSDKSDSSPKQQITSASPKLEDKPAEELLTKFSHNVNNLSMISGFTTNFEQQQLMTFPNFAQKRSYNLQSMFQQPNSTAYNVPLPDYTKAMINEAQNKGIQSGTNTTSNAFRAAGFI